MSLFRRRLFWKIYLTLLASLVAAIVVMGAFFWFLGEAQREATLSAGTAHHGPHNVTLFAEDGTVVGTRGRQLSLADWEARHRRWGPNHVVRVDLPGGGFVLTRLGPPRGARATALILLMLSVAGGGGLAAYPVTALLTRRLEALRAGVARWGEDGAPPRLEERGHDEVALLGRTFNQAATRLASLLASQKALLANASHELRSPLARLRVAVEVGLGETQDATRAEIVRNLVEMDGLVEELLLSSRLDHPESRRDRRERIDLLGLAAEEAARHDADLTGEPVEIEGDAVLLRRLIRNLLDNAAKHGRPPVAIAVARDGAGATITVSDAGRSLPPEQRERIFEPFYRPSGSGESAGGWGLGLALVRQIAECHGGSATCDATAAGGTRFVVRLTGPAARPQRVVAAASRNAARSAVT